jgi:hypothetical protein
LRSTQAPTVDSGAVWIASSIATPPAAAPPSDKAIKTFLAWSNVDALMV